MTISKKQKKSSRAWSLGRPHGRKKQYSALRRERTKLRKELQAAQRSGNLEQATELASRTKRVVEASARMLGRAHGFVRRMAGRGK